jgi:hypothetical protein
MRCPLCSFEFDETGMACASSCPMASLQGCHLVCCPNCGYQTVDETKSGIARFLRRVWKTPDASSAGAKPPDAPAPPEKDRA